MQWQAILTRIAQHLQHTHADPTQSVVLLPFAQLVPLARKQWAQRWPCSLLPRFETTSSWAQRLHAFAPDANDISRDAARDLLTAQRLVQQTPWARQSHWLAARVYEAAMQLAPLAAAQHPQARASWGADMQQQLIALHQQRHNELTTLDYEQAIAAIAITWAAHSAYATDALFAAIDAGQLQALLVLNGLQPDPLAHALHTQLAAQRPQAVCVLQWDEAQDEAQDEPQARVQNPATLPPVRLHTAAHFEDQAQRAAACVQQAVERGQGLVALVDNDRALTRRIRALLDGQGLALRDETGWKLSTIHAASQLMALLRACSAQAESDAVLAWLKLAQAAQAALADQSPTAPQQQAEPAAPPAPLSATTSVTTSAPEPQAATAITAEAVSQIESHLRSHSHARWPSLPYWQKWAQKNGVNPAIGNIDGNVSINTAQALACRVEQWRQALTQPRPLQQWLADVRCILHHTGQWQWLAQDDAGSAVLQSLHWQTGAAPLLEAQANSAAPSWTQAAFTHWASQVIEAGKYNPSHPQREQVALVPLSQLLLRPFAAVVIPGCDEKRLPVVPEPQGIWTPAQRALLGMGEQAQLQSSQRRAWQYALSYAQVDVLYSSSEDGASQQPSPLLLECLLQSQIQSQPQSQLAPQSTAQSTAQATPAGASLRPICPAPDPRPVRPLPAAPQTMPQPQSQRLPVTHLSASSYATLRECPYSFFALHQLNLQQAQELTEAIEKRDFGNWLHRTLQIFHEQLHAEGLQPASLPAPELATRLDAAANQAKAEKAFDEAEFLPWQLGWHKLRDGYLQWLLHDYAKEHAEFVASEEKHNYLLAQAIQAASPTQPAPALPPQPVTLRGSIDRIDRLPAMPAEHAEPAQRMLIDYKTEQADKTKKRITQDGEDTQLAFYAALLPDTAVRLAYLNISEKGQAVLHEQHNASALRQQLLQGIAHDLHAIAQGSPLPALGQGARCGYCAARGLCRRDFWQEQTA